jgi:hypothetical protein
VDEIRRIILEAKVSALIEHAIPAFERAALAFLAELRKGITPTLEQVTALSEELYYLQLQGEDAVEVLAPLEDELTNKKIAELNDEVGLEAKQLNAILNLGYTLTGYTPNENEFTTDLDINLALFRRFLEGLDG